MKKLILLLFVINLISCNQKMIDDKKTEKVLEKADSVLIDHDKKKDETIKIMQQIIVNDSLKNKK